MLVCHLSDALVCHLEQLPSPVILSEFAAGKRIEGPAVAFWPWGKARPSTPSGSNRVPPAHRLTQDAIGSTLDYVASIQKPGSGVRPHRTTPTFAEEIREFAGHVPGRTNFGPRHSFPRQLSIRQSSKDSKDLDAPPSRRFCFCRQGGNHQAPTPRPRYRKNASRRDATKLPGSPQTGPRLWGGLAQDEMQRNPWNSNNLNVEPRQGRRENSPG